MNKFMQFIRAYFSRIKTSTLLFSCLLFIGEMIYSTTYLGVKWQGIQVFPILALTGLFGLIVLLRKELDLIIIRINGQSAIRVGILILTISIIMFSVLCSYIILINRLN